MSTVEQAAITSMKHIKESERKAPITVGDLIGMLSKLEPSMPVAIAYDQGDQVLTHPPRVENLNRVYVEGSNEPCIYTSGMGFASGMEFVIL